MKKRGYAKHLALTVPCPSCGAYDGKPCYRPDNSIRKSFHIARHVSARLAGVVVKPKKLDPQSKAYAREWARIRAKVFAAKGAQCTYCGKDAEQVDHRLPRCRGGSDDMSNLEPSCRRCNMAKGVMTVEEWLG